VEQGQDNTVHLYGVIAGMPTFSHRLYGENFYSFLLRVPRLSNSADLLPVTISERLLNRCVTKGMTVHIFGQLRSYNKNVDGINHLILTVFVRQLQKEDAAMPSINRVQLLGHICKEPIYRTTPFMREITDLLLAVNRPYGKSDYIPAIVWGRTARFARTLKVGDCVRIVGRFQSRAYQKRQPDGNVEEKMAYEVSVSGLERTNSI
jgi:hypothetical protein